MFSKVLQYARKPITIAFLLNLVLWLPSYIDRHDGPFTPRFCIAAIVLVAMTTLVTYAGYVVITKAFNRKPMMLNSYLVSLGLWLPRQIDRHDGPFTPRFCIAAIIKVAMMTLVTYALYVVIDKALNYAGALFKRIFRNRTPKM